MVFVEFGDGGFELQGLASRLQPLHEIGSALNRTRKPFSTSARPIAEAQWLLPAPGRTKQQQIGCLVEPGIAGGKGHDARFAEHRHDGEVEVVERLTRQQARLGQVSPDAPLATLGNLQLGQSREEAGGGPALLVGALG